MARFTLPRDLYHGKGSLETLKTLKGKKAIICVGGGSMKRFGFLDSYVTENTVFKNKIRNFAAPNLRTVNLYSQNLDERTFHVSFLRQYTRIVLSFFQIPKQSI